jgi:hypothetical protein
MRKGVIAAAIGLCSVVVFAAETPAPVSIPKEGKTSATQVTSGSFQIVRLGKDRFRASYDVMGVRISDDKNDILHYVSLRCVGAMNMVNGSFDDESGSCIFTRPDGDQVFGVFTAKGQVGADAKGTMTLVGGTGKMAGIEGTSEFTRHAVRPAADGTAQTISWTTGTYKLPAASAAR